MSAEERLRSSALGIVLIGLGVAFLAAQALDVDLGTATWPFFVILPGAALLAYGLVEARSPRGGLAVPGLIVTTTGLLLLYQSSTSHWESWAYAWALVAPTSVGVALMLLGALAGNASMLRGGAWSALVGLILFATGFTFFEGVLRISGRDFGALGQVGFPLLLIGLGVALLVPRLGALRRDQA